MDSPQTKKNSEKTENSDEFPIESPNQKFLQIENYCDFQSKSGVHFSLIPKDEYRACFKLISETFLIEFDNFSRRDLQKKLQSDSQSSQNQLQISKLSQILEYSKKHDFVKSFAGFTRKTNNLLLILVLRSKNNKNSLDNNSSDGHLRFLLLNDEGRIIHVVSNRAPGAAKKLTKMVKKFFSKLRDLFILDPSSNLQEIELILQGVIDEKLTKSLIIISPSSQQLVQASNGHEKDPEFQTFSSELSCLQNHDLNIPKLHCFIRCQKGHQISNLNQNIDNILTYQRTYDFIAQKALRPSILTKISQNVTSFNNQWLNNVISWYFNIMRNIGDDLLLERSPNQALKIINNKVSIYFEKKIKQKSSQDQHYNAKIQKGCYPKLLAITKVCTVCKKRKPKYGCMKCSEKYDMTVNLCIQDCFKAFHHNLTKYLPKKAKSRGGLNQEEKLTSKMENGIMVDQNLGKTQKTRESEILLGVEKNYKSQEPFQRYKTIRKRAKMVERQGCCQIKKMRLGPSYLIDFRGMQWSDEKGTEMVSEVRESEKIKINISQNSSKISQEESYSMET